MSITPKRKDINNKILPSETILTFTKPTLNTDNSSIDIKLFSKDDKELASYKYEINTDNIPSPETISVMEGLVVARFATESLINVVNQTTLPIFDGYSKLLSAYGMANIELINFEMWNRKNTKYQENTLMFSGGIDSSHLLFKHLKGNCNLVSFNHGQSNYRSGIHSEEAASFLVPALAREYFSLSMPQKRVRARWKCNTERKWAKAYRNLMFMVHAFSIFPGNIYVGTSLDDRLHDSFPDFISLFSQVTEIPVFSPNITTGRDVIMKDIISLSLEDIPYLYSSTSSCQLQRYTGKKFLNEGSCHSCLLRLPAVMLGGDPRFNNFNKSLKLVPSYLEGTIKPDQFYQRKPSPNALKKFFNDLSDNNEAFKCFISTLNFIEADWRYNIDNILVPEQIKIYRI